MRLAREHPKDGGDLDQWLCWFVKLARVDKYKTLRQIAAEEDVDPGYVSRMMNMNLLCPEIVRRILDDDIEADFAFNEIYRDIPVRWDEQFKKFKIPLNS